MKRSHDRPTPRPKQPLSGVYTSNLAGTLNHYDIRLAVSTCQAGKVSPVRMSMMKLRSPVVMAGHVERLGHGALRL